MQYESTRFYSCCEQFTQSPNGVGDSGFHCRCATDRRMDAAEVVVSEVECQGGPEVFPFLRETNTETAR